MLKLYGIPNCNTVKKARSWLDEHHINYEFHDFKKLGLDSITAQAWVKQQPWEKLINRAGMTWRNLTEAEKASVTDANSAISLMQNKTSVIKRPVLVNSDAIISLGFDEATYGALLIK